MHALLAGIFANFVTILGLTYNQSSAIHFRLLCLSMMLDLGRFSLDCLVIGNSDLGLLKWTLAL